MFTVNDYNYKPLIKILAKSYEAGLKDSDVDEEEISLFHQINKISDKIEQSMDRDKGSKTIQKQLVELAYTLGLLFTAERGPTSKEFVMLAEAGTNAIFKKLARIAKTVKLEKHKVSSIEEYLTVKNFHKRSLWGIEAEARRFTVGSGPGVEYSANKYTRQAIRNIGEFLVFVVAD